MLYCIGNAGGSGVSVAGGHSGETSSVSAPYIVNLEFRGTKPWRLIVHSAERFRLLMGALCDVIQVDLQKFQLGKLTGPRVFH